MGVVGVLVFAVALGMSGIWGLLHSSGRLDDSLVGADRPSKKPVDPNAGESINMLLMGTDDRTGDNASISGGGEANHQSDTTILVHMSADRSRIELVSIPRDSMVDIPECTTSNGTTAACSHAMFNSAFAVAYDQGGDVQSGAACTVHTVESLTGIRIDDFAVADFNGFKTMIDALGGVTTCIAEDVYAPHAGGLRLSAGQQKLNGWEATEYARARTGEGLGDGSDLARIQRQQKLLGSVASEIKTKNYLTDSAELYRFFQAASKSLYLSDGLDDFGSLVGVSYSLRDIDLSDVVFKTVPTTEDPYNLNRVVWTSAADDLWKTIYNDEPIVAKPSPAASPTTSAEPRPSATAADTPAPTASSSASTSSAADAAAACR